MQMVTNATGAVQLTLTDHEANQLEKFLHLAAMCNMTWPICVGDFMTKRKEWHDLRRKTADGDSEGSDPPAPGVLRGA